MVTFGPALYQFDWGSNFNGTSGGISSLGNIFPIDIGSGQGGITIFNEQYLDPLAAPLHSSNWLTMLLGFACLGFTYRRRLGTSHVRAWTSIHEFIHQCITQLLKRAKWPYLVGDGPFANAESSL
jgi:hypothetical protein